MRAASSTACTLRDPMRAMFRSLATDMDVTSVRFNIAEQAASPGEQMMPCKVLQ